jgi:hypothetical protein
MLRTLLTVVALRRVLGQTQAQSVDSGVSSAIAGAIDPGSVVAAATGIIAVVGGIVVTLKLGPGWAFKMVRKMVGAVK